MPEQKIESTTALKKIVRRWERYRRKTSLVRAVRMPCLFGFTCSQGEWISGRTGDWLVQFDDGRMKVVKHDIFRVHYLLIRKKK
jgi:hypothetical protein